MGSSGGRGARWDGRRVRALRRHLGVTQQALARELGTRQQTISEWETGAYAPGGISSRLLSIMAERAGFAYEAGGGGDAAGEGPGEPPAEG